MFGGIAITCIGLVGVAFAVRGVLAGEISMLWSLLGGWGQLSSTYSRDDSPVAFWGATLFYGAAGLLLAAFGVYRLVAAPG